MKTLTFVSFFILHSAGWAQRAEFTGFSKTCDGNLAAEGYRMSHFKIKQYVTRDSIIYQYTENQNYYVLNGKDTADKYVYDGHCSQIVTYFPKDSSLVIAWYCDDTTIQRLHATSVETDAWLHLPALVYAYSNPDDPDAEMFYYFHPAYGFLKRKSDVWFTEEYYYHSGHKFQKYVDCSKNDKK